MTDFANRIVRWKATDNGYTVSLNGEVIAEGRTKAEAQSIARSWRAEIRRPSRPHTLRILAEAGI